MLHIEVCSGYTTSSSHGWLGLFGQSVTQDDEEAVKWYRRSAKQGYDSAQYYLGLMYECGRGVTQDDEEAVKWFGKAAGRGHKVAERRLAKKTWS